MDKHHARIVLVAIVILGAVPRYALIGYGLPNLYHPDEIALVHETYKFWLSIFNLNFALSTNVFSHLLGLVHGFQLMICVAVGPCTSIGDFQRLVLLDDPSLYLTGRVMSATFDLGNIYLTYRLASGLFGRAAGLLAAAGYAACAVPLGAAPWLKMDSTSTFFTLLAHIGILRAVRGQSARGWYVAGALTGLAVATRINAAPLAVTLLLAWFVVGHRSGVPELGAAGRAWPTIGVATGIMLCTYMLLSFRAVELLSLGIGQHRLFQTQPYLEVIASKVATIWTGGEWRDPFTIISENAAFYLRVLVMTVGWLGLAGMTGGILMILLQGEVEAKLALVFPGLYLIPVLGFPWHASHYVLLMLPFLFSFLGGLAVCVTKMLQPSPARIWKPALAVLALALLIKPTEVSAIYAGHLLSNAGVDTRSRAKAWIESNIPAGETIAIEKYHELPTLAPPLAETLEENEQKLLATRELGLGSGRAREERLRERATPAYQIVNISMAPVFGPRGRAFENQYDFDLLLGQGVHYVILGDYIRESYLPGDLYPKFTRLRTLFRERLEREGELVEAFNPQARPETIEVIRLLAWFIVDPPLQIFRLNTSGDTRAGRSARLFSPGRS